MAGKKNTSGKFESSRVESGELPAGWRTVTLGEATTVVRGITFPSSAKQFEHCNKTVCCLRTSNIQKEIDWSDIYFVDRSFVKRSEQFVEPGDILMSMANSYELVGKVAIAKKVPYETAFGAFLSAIRPSSQTDGNYLFSLLRSEAVQLALREGSSQTTNIANISVGKLSSIVVPLAPLPEQKVIAEKLDALLAQVDSLKARLDAIPVVLKRFRQSVLSAAVSGKLTEDWRGGNEKKWINTTIEELSAEKKYALAIGPFGSNLKVSDYRETGHPLVFVREIRANSYQDEKSKFVDDVKFTELLPHRVSSGDLLITKMGDPPGDVSIYPSNRPDAIITSDCIKLTVNTNIASIRFIYLLMQSEEFRSLVLEISAGVAQQKVSLTKFRRLSISLPPLPEQAEIVRRVEQLFAFADQVEARVKAAQSRTQHLTQAILAKAFRGELTAEWREAQAKSYNC